MNLKSAAFVLVISAMALLGCSGKSKKSMKGDEDVSREDFVEFFDPVTLPFSFGDTLLGKKGSDTFLIDQKVFDKFLGDSILKKDYKKEKPKIYAMGKFQNGEAETYLLFRTKGSQNNVYAVALDQQLFPQASLLLLSNKGPLQEVNTVGIDRRFTFTQIDEYKNEKKEPLTYSTVYAYNTAGLFMVILNDGVKRGGAKADVLNLIDTFPQLHPHSGDYGRDKKNFLSVRDGSDTKNMLFFLAMDKGTDCQADLKGEARWIGKDSAIYDSNLDGCKISFYFKGKTVKITEMGGCASRRPEDCTFNASYSKQTTSRKTGKKK